MRQFGQQLFFRSSGNFSSFSFFLTSWLGPCTWASSTMSGFLWDDSATRPLTFWVKGCCCQSVIQFTQFTLNIMNFKWKIRPIFELAFGVLTTEEMLRAGGLSSNHAFNSLMQNSLWIWWANINRTEVVICIVFTQFPFIRARLVMPVVVQLESLLLNFSVDWKMQLHFRGGEVG